MRWAIAGPLLLAVGVVLAVVVLHRTNPRTLISAHGFLHAAVVMEFRGDALRVPPENPFFAGHPLPYYWFFHWLAAQLGRPFGLDPLRSLELVILLATVAGVAAGGRLGWQLHRRARAAVFLPALALLGAHPQAPLVLLLRALRHGLAEDDGTYLWGIAHPLMAQMRLWDPFALYGPLLNFFLNVTSRPAALMALLAALLCLYGFLTRGAPGSGLALVASSAVCTALSPLVGLGATLSLAAALALAAWRLPEDAPPPRRVAAGAGLLVLGAAAAAPTYAQLLVAGGEGLPLQDLAGLLSRLRSMLASAWLVAILALLGAWTSVGAARFFGSALVLACAALLAGAALARLPVANEVNFFHAALVLLAVPAAGAAARSRPVSLAVAAAFLPTAGLILFAYTGRAPAPLAIRDAAYVRLPETSDRSRLYTWIRTQTAADTVLLLEPDSAARTCCGNTAELPAFTGRRLFTERSRHYLVEPYAEAGRRERLARALVSGERPSAEDAAYLASLGRPILVLTDEDGPSRLESTLGAPVFRSGSLVAYYWRPAP